MESKASATVPYGQRRIGAISAIKMHALVPAGNSGVWAGMFSTYDCAIKGIRQKKDARNAIGAGFITGGSRWNQIPKTDGG
ncbi:hypothetical protein GQ607_009752 [Colletotrichum asianum]|uniref:Uncharacterized protein n=1 Tax=Colletotrichum asianum TaxID=702518 RepID=A0A8H3ZKB2_9PEZI|nr:hypothetical protein GQ607_009752 [Colletotrichum asianum]